MGRRRRCGVRPSPDRGIRPAGLGRVPHEGTQASGVLGAATELVRARHRDLDVHALQFPEPPVQSLLSASETAEFVVLGSRGLDGFRGLLVGSTTMHVAPYAHCPVVVVHERQPGAQDSSEADSSEADSSEAAPHAGQVVLGYDGSPASNRASAFAFRHAAAIGSGVVVVSVEVGKADPEMRDVDPDLAAPGSDTGAFHAPLVVTAASFPTVPVTFVAGTGRPAEVLIEQASGCELLAVGIRGRGGFTGLLIGSVSQKVVAYAACPVAIVHEGVAATTAAGISG